MAKYFKIAIDVSPLNDGNAVRGVGYYTKHLVEALNNELKINPQYKNWQIDLITNKLDLRSKIYNLIHYPYFDPFKLTLPKRKDTPIIVTVHDLIPIQFKNQFPVGVKGYLSWLNQKHNLKKTDYIITVSHYSKQIIKNIIKYPEDKIYVTYEGADSIFKPRKDEKELKDIRNKFKLPNKFILYVGDINWNKNIPSLVKACIQLKYPLVIVGSAAVKNVENHPWTKDIIWLQKQKSQYLHLTGFISDQDLAILFNLATIYCQPSYAEGFGLPLVQAMKSGCPVAFSSETSLPEVMDYNGIMFNPYSLVSIKNSLKKLWNNLSLQEKYSKAGLKQARIFDWKFTAKQTLSVYDLALNHGKKQ